MRGCFDIDLKVCRLGCQNRLPIPPTERTSQLSDLATIPATATAIKSLALLVCRLARRWFFGKFEYSDLWQTRQASGRVNANGIFSFKNMLKLPKP